MTLASKFRRPRSLISLPHHSGQSMIVQSCLVGPWQMPPDSACSLVAICSSPFHLHSMKGALKCLNSCQFVLLCSHSFHCCFRTSSFAACREIAKVTWRFSFIKRGAPTKHKMCGSHFERFRFLGSSASRLISGTKPTVPQPNQLGYSGHKRSLTQRNQRRHNKKTQQSTTAASGFRFQVLMVMCLMPMSRSRWIRRTAFTTLSKFAKGSPQPWR